MIIFNFARNDKDQLYSGRYINTYLKLIINYVSQHYDINLRYLLNKRNSRFHPNISSISHCRRSLFNIYITDYDGCKYVWRLFSLKRLETGGKFRYALCVNIRNGKIIYFVV